MRDPKLIKAGCNLKPYFKELVETAVNHQNHEVTDLSKFYLVNLLSEFIKTEELFVFEDGHYEEKPLAILLAKAMESDEPTRVKLFKKIGDTSLYIAGFFADHIDSKKVDIEYYIAMGEGAYQNLSGIFIAEKTFAELYAELATKFGSFVNILSEVSLPGDIHSNKDLIRLYEKWLKTGDKRIRDKLEKEGIVPKDISSNKNH